MLLAVEREGAYANLVLQKPSFTLGLRAVDIALLTELVYGTLRWQNTLDWAIDRFSKVPVARMNYIVRNIVRLGVYQLLFLERVPVAAACNESVELAKKWRLDDLAGFVNGLLRNIARHRDHITYPSLEEEPVLHISVKYSHPAWLVERWLKRFGRQVTIALCQANNEPPPVVLRCNTLKVTPDELRRELEQEGVVTNPSPFLAEGLRVSQLTALTRLVSFQAGHFVVQDESSMLASIILRPAAGSLVVDACSGPGGKTAHLAQVMRDTGRLVAFDVHPHRLKLIRDACQRLGITIVETRLQDAREIPQDLLGKVDYLLVDAPCSGLGVIRRRPDLRWRVSEQDLAVHARQQLQILTGACKCLKRGGTMLYSTCSTEPEENYQVIEQLLSQHPHFQAEDISSSVPVSFLVSEEDYRTARRGYLQLLPHRHGTDGFFLAALRKTS